MNIYLAAPYRRRCELRGYARELEEMGHIVTSTWLDVARDHLRNDTGDTVMLGMWAFEDCWDIERADVLIAFTVPIEEYRRGGMHVEMGYALGRGLRVIEVGDNHPNLFYNLSTIEHFATWVECKEGLGK